MDTNPLSDQEIKQLIQVLKHLRYAKGPDSSWVPPPPERRRKEMRRYLVAGGNYFSTDRWLADLAGYPEVVLIPSDRQVH